jgi:hypothetical protein
MSRRRKPTFYGALNEAAVALLDRQHRVWPREVVAHARNLHAELFELERERLVMQAAERIAKQVMKDLTEDDDDGRSPSACQLVLLDLALPTAIALPDEEGAGDGFVYVRADKATWSELVAGGEIRDRNVERAQAKRDAYWESVDYLRPIMEQQPELTVAEALRIIRPGQVA